MSAVQIATIERALARRFPVERAETWDRVGLLAGDASADVTGVVLALDPTREAIAETVRRGANVLVTHHPAFLEPPARIVPGPGPGGVLFDALAAGVALLNTHTNLDRDPEAQRRLPGLLGLVAAEPFERSVMPMALVTVYAPSVSVERIVTAMTAAGAGRIGDYTGCSFTVDGVGSFTPPAGAHPFVGTPAEPSIAEEQRVEMVSPRERVRAVVSAAIEAHPYEEPLVTATDVAIARNEAAIGMVCEPQDELSLAGLASIASTAFGAAPRVWGDPEALAGTIVTTTGSAGSLIGGVRAAGATTLVCGEVRYHDALDAKEAGVAIVELGHDVSEWPLVTLLARTVSAIPGIDPATVHVLEPRPAWWTA